MESANSFEAYRIKQDISLEEAIIQEVDTWQDVELRFGDRTASYTDKIKPIYYGIGIDVANRTKKTILPSPNESLLSMTLSEAVAYFRKDLIIAAYLKTECNPVESSKILRYKQRSEGLYAAQGFYGAAKKLGIDFEDIRQNPEKYIQKLSDRYKSGALNKETRKKLIAAAKKRILEYRDFFRLGFGLIVKKYLNQMAARFVDTTINHTLAGISNINDYFGLGMQGAVDKFKAEYITAQLERAEWDPKKAAEYTGTTLANLSRICTRKLGKGLRELRKENRA